MIRRLGTPPHLRTGPDRSMCGSTCPDILLDGGRVIVIGRLLDGLPDGAPGNVGPGEAVVALPLTVMLDAARDLLAHADQPKETRPCPK